jgi:hypothetical protein
MIKHPIGNKVFITLPNALQEKIKTESGLELYIDGSFNHEDWSTVEGVVHSVGRRCKLDLQKGETVVIHYLVTSQFYTNGDTRTYLNVKYYDGEVVWEAEEDMILAKKVGDHWEGVGRWVVLEDIEEKENPKSSLIFIPDSISSKKRKGCGMYNGGILELPKETICHFKEEFRSYYRFPDGKERMILNSELIYGYE